ncbi:MAG: HAD hydrolase-like protein [Elusimicrobiales bacterium]|nr:HAD hydrolase-like protein [Elusimicrobiales bacterium]
MKLVLFDLDGTLVKAGHAGSRALDYAIQHMTGFENASSKIDLNGTTDKVNFTNAYRVAAGHEPSGEQLKEITDRYLARLPHEVEWSVQNGLYSILKGIEAFLECLSKHKNVLVGMGTGNVERGAFIKLAPSGLGRYFPYGGYGEDSHNRSKMLRVGVQRGCFLADLRPGEAEAYVIGDTHKDVYAAKEAGFHSAVVTSGFGDPAKITESQPDFLQPDYENIDAWLKWLGID